MLRHLIAAAPPGSLGPSARFAGFADSLAGALTEIEASLLDPEDLGPGLAELTRAYRAELERLAVRDRGMVRRRAVERLTSELGSWNGAPVFAYGFEDLTGAEWRLIEALAARGEVHVSLPYEPGRAAFASLSRTVADLGALAGGDIVELAPGSERLPAAWPRPSRAPPLRRHRHAGAARQLGALPRGSRPSRHARARRRDRARARPRRHRPGGDRDRLPVARALPRVDRDGLRRARRSRLDRGAATPGGDGVRTGAALVAPLRLGQRHASASSSPSCGRRTPVSAAATSTSSKAGCAGAPSSVETARSRRRRSCAPAARCRCSSCSPTRTRRSPPPARSCSRWRGTPTASALLPSAPSPSAISAPPKPRARSSTSSSGCRRQGSRFGPRTCSPLSTAPPCAATQPASPGASRCSTSRAPARAASRPSS